MAILKNKTQGNFVIVSKNILKDKALKLRERGMLVTLLSLPDNWQLSIKGLTKILIDGRDSIQACLKILEEKGYLVRIQERKAKGKFGNIILEIHTEPTVEPNPVNPYTDKPYAGLPDTVNQPQYNNNKSSNNKLKNNKKKEGGNDGNRNKWTAEEKQLYRL